jgi:hypothetical protein
MRKGDTLMAVLEFEKIQTGVWSISFEGDSFSIGELFMEEDGQYEWYMLEHICDMVVPCKRDNYENCLISQLLDSPASEEYADIVESIEDFVASKGYDNISAWSIVTEEVVGKVRDYLECNGYEPVSDDDIVYWIELGNTLKKREFMEEVDYEISSAHVGGYLAKRVVEQSDLLQNEVVNDIVDYALDCIPKKEKGGLDD